MEMSGVSGRVPCSRDLVMGVPITGPSAHFCVVGRPRLSLQKVEIVVSKRCSSLCLSQASKDFRRPLVDQADNILPFWIERREEASHNGNLVDYQVAQASAGLEPMTRSGIGDHIEKVSDKCRQVKSVLVIAAIVRGGIITCYWAPWSAMSAQTRARTA